MEGVCTECECGVEAFEASLICVGGCGRRFHCDCVQERAATSWRCPACTLDVLRCAQCRKYELRECLRLCTLCDREGLCSECASGLAHPWDCGGHSCGACGAPTTANSWRCVRCPAAYCRGCRPAASVLIASCVIKCVTHVKETLPPLDIAMLKRRAVRARRKKPEKRPSDVALDASSGPPKNEPREAVEEGPAIPKRLRQAPVSLADKLKAALRARPDPVPLQKEEPSAAERSPSLPALPAADEGLGLLTFEVDEDLGLGLPGFETAAEEEIVISEKPPPQRSLAADILARLEQYGY